MATTDEKKSFVMYADLAEHVRLLDDAEAGRLFRAILAYAGDGAEPEDLTPAGEMLFSVVRAQIDRDAAKWTAKKKARQEAGKQGGEAKAENERKRKQTKDELANSSKKDFAREDVANQAVNVPVPVNVPVSVIGRKDSSASATPRTRSARFTPPTQEEVERFMRENGGNADDAGKFCDYYAANGWKVGRATMKNWQAAARGWLRRDGKFTSATGGTDTNKYDLYAAFEGVVNGKS